MHSKKINFCFNFKFKFFTCCLHFLNFFRKYVILINRIKAVMRACFCSHIAIFAFVCIHRLLFIYNSRFFDLSSPHTRIHTRHTNELRKQIHYVYVSSIQPMRLDCLLFLFGSLLTFDGNSFMRLFITNNQLFG